MNRALDKKVFTQKYNFTDCLAMEINISLHHTLTTMTLGAAYAAGIIDINLWAIITPTTEGYRVDLFREEEYYHVGIGQLKEE